MAMSSLMAVSATICHHLPRLHIIVSFLVSSTIVSSSKANLRYSDHCASIVPESAPTDPELTNIPFPAVQDGYYLGGDRIQDVTNLSNQFYDSPVNRRMLVFLTNNVYNTVIDGVYKVGATVLLQTSGMSLYVEDIVQSHSYSPQVIPEGSQTGALSFKVEGFWSKSAGKLCMVGSTYIDLEQGKRLAPEGVLKLYDVKSSGDITSLVTGTLESLSLEDSPSFFDPITLLMLHKQDYKYNEVSKTIDGDCHGGDNIPTSTSLSLPLSRSLCSIFSRLLSFRLKYASDCKYPKTCSPFGEDSGYFSPVMSLSLVECSKDGQSLRFLLEFPDGGFTNFDFAFNPSTTLIAEGSWNAKKNQLCVVACRIFSAVGSLNGSYIGDCSIRLSFRFPALWSIRNTRYIEGQIRSNKKTNDVGHFNRIVFGSNQNEFTEIPGLQYTYTMVEKARATCLKDKPSRNKEKQHPEGNSQGMQFQMFFKNSKGREMGWGKARPISVGDQFHPGSGNEYVMNPPSSQPAKIYHSSLLNISYSMNIMTSDDENIREYKHVEITAEGIYNAETGAMCLVGCKRLDLNNPTVTDDSMDCEILINLQFPTIESRDYIKGYIESQRRKTDLLFFESLSFSAVSLPNHEASELVHGY